MRWSYERLVEAYDSRRMAVDDAADKDIADIIDACKRLARVTAYSHEEWVNDVARFIEARAPLHGIMVVLRAEMERKGA